MRTHIITLLVGALLSASSIAGPVYKWVDSKGIVNYTSLPPDDGRHKVTELGESKNVPDGTIQIQKSAPAVAAADSPDGSGKDKISKDAGKLYPKASVKECITAQSTIEFLKKGERTMRMKPNGEKEYLDDKGRQQEITKAETFLKEGC